MKKFSKINIYVALLAAFTLTGCAGKEVVRPKVYWPPPPSTPKMEWISSFASEDNFPKTEGQISAEKFFGTKAVTFLRKPMGVASRGDGVVYVSDLDAGNIRVIDFNNKTMTLFSEKAPVGLPLGLTVDSHGFLYVADTYSNQVLVFNDRREMVKAIGSGILGKPTFVALDESRNRLYVSDVIKNLVVVFDLASGEKLFAMGGQGDAAGNLYGPQGIAVDREGKIFVAEQLNARIQVFSPDGKFLYMFGKRGDSAFEFEGPRGLAFDSDGDLFVAETRKAAVLVFSPDGTPLTRLGGGRSLHPLGFTLPSAVFVDHNDRVYITDGMNRRLTIWQMLTPEYLAENPLDTESLRKVEEKILRLQEKPQ